MKNIYLILLGLCLFCACDPCNDIICENGGTCIDGECDCTGSYSGSDCSDEVAPSEMYLNTVTVLNYQDTNSVGDDLDMSSQPDTGHADLIVVAYDYTTAQGIILKTATNETTLWNALPTGDHIFHTDPSWKMATPLGQYSIAVSDDDVLSGDDNINLINFTPYTAGMGFPTTINLVNGNLSLSLGVSYTP